MTRKAASSIFALAFAVSAGTAAAADQGFVNNATGEGVFARPVAAHSKSRDQVRAELAEAVRAGNVIANNVTQRPTANRFEHDLYAYAGSAKSHGYNWVSTDASQGLNPVATDVTDTAITLGVLQFNSGPTKTKLPPAELGDVPLGHCLDGSGAQLTVDQRGQPRPGPNGTCYRGAVEPQSSELP